MKKKLIISLIIVAIVLSVATIIGLNYKSIIKKRNQEHYAKIMENIQLEIETYIKLTKFYCNPERGENTGTTVYTDETLVNQRGMDKELLLDVDGKSYCKVRVEVKCVAVNEFAWDTYLKCKNYEDVNYSNWEERHVFMGTILEVNKNSIIVEPSAGSHERKSSDKIIIKRVNTDNYEIGDKLKITYNGLIEESYPAQITANEIELIK